MRSKLDASWIKLPEKIDFYLIFEFPEPWDRKIELSNHFPILLREYLQEIKDTGHKFKFLCVKPNNKYQKIDKRSIRILFYKGNPRDFVSYQKIELLIPSMDLVSKYVKSLVEANVNYFNKYKIENNHTRDIFICVHGERDQCCGKFGIEIYNKLKETIQDTSNIRIWETSHMGGHRVSPTLMDMPSGRFWGYLEPSNVELIINEKSNHHGVVKNYRGRMGLDRYSQIVEKTIFKSQGWEWFRNSLRSEIISRTNNEVKVLIHYKSNNHEGQLSATVQDIGSISLPKSNCSKDTKLTRFVVNNLKEELN
jgi:hypothetical protein